MQLSKHVFLFLSVSFLIIACDENKVEPSQVTIDADTEVYIAVQEENSKYNKIAKYWKNETWVNLTDGASNAEVNDITVSGEDVYTCGRASAQAIYWKNNIATPMADKEVTSDARSIHVINNDVYVAGQYDSKVTFWKNTVPTVLSSSENKLGTASTVYAFGSDVYVAATFFDEKVYTAIPYVWKNGNENVPEPGTEFGSQIEGMFVSGEDVYLAGRAVNDNSWYIARYWKNGVATNLTDGRTYAEANAIFVSGQDVYVAGTVGEQTQSVATYWKNGKAVALTDGTTQATVKDIWVYKNDVYAVGYEKIGDINIAKLWKNGIVKNLTDGTHQAEATAIFIRPRTK